MRKRKHETSKTHYQHNAKANPSRTNLQSDKVEHGVDHVPRGLRLEPRELALKAL